jgi:hypothetical protein
MAETSWDDVGRQFAELGRKLQGAWEDARAADATAEMKDAGEKVKAALEDVAETVKRVTASPEIHDTARQATVSVADALASSLHEVADRLSASAAKRGQSGSGGSEPGASTSASGNGDRALSSSSEE